MARQQRMRTGKSCTERDLSTVPLPDNHMWLKGGEQPAQLNWSQYIEFPNQMTAVELPNLSLIYQQAKSQAPILLVYVLL